MGRAALLGSSATAQELAGGRSPRAPRHRPPLQQELRQDLHRPRLRPRQHRKQTGTQHNFAEGLREIKEALRLEPRNQEALNYLEKIRNELKEREPEREEEREENPSKVKVTADYDLVRKR